MGTKGLRGEVTSLCDDAAEQGERSVEALRCEGAGGDSEEGASAARATVGEWRGEEHSDETTGVR